MDKEEEKVMGAYPNKIKKKIFIWICTEKFKLLQVAILILLSLASTVPTKILSDGGVNTLVFLLSIILVSYNIIKNYKESKKVSIIYLFGINIISMICFLGSSHMIFNIVILWIRTVAFITLVIWGLLLVWKAKVQFINKFNRYLILSLLTVILNFGGVYGSLYSMYFHTAQECFDIDQKLSYPRVVMPLDFVYYSADAFFGTEISDVKIKYIDYMDYHKKEKIISHYAKNHYKAMFVTNIAKIFSLIESLLFIIYISMIVMNKDNQEST